MKKLLTFLMMSILAIGVGWAGTYSLTPNQTSTGSTSTSYITNLTEFTYNNVGWAMNQWNPKTLQIKTNQSSAASEFRFYNTSAFPGKITKVVISFSALTLTNTTTTGFMFIGGTSEVTETTGGTNGVWNSSDKTITWTPESSDSFTYFAFYQNGTVATGTNKLATADAIVVTYEESTPSSIATPVISGTTPFEGSTEVSITCETDGASIYYTLDGTDPTTSSSQYSAPFTINETTTVKAIAALDGETSGIATKTFTATPLIASVAEFNALTAGTNFKYTGNNLVAIAQTSNGASLYVQDGDKGMLIFKNGGIGQTYELGNKIPADFTGTRSEYNGAPEMTNPAGFAASTESVELTPIEMTASDVKLDNFGLYGVIKNASFDTENKIIIVGEEEIPYHTTFLTPPTDGAVYDVYGVVGSYKQNNDDAYAQFLPFKVEEVVSDVNYYLVGSFNGWAEQDENYKFTALANGEYKLTGKTLSDGVTFKVIKKNGESVTWLGGTNDGDYEVKSDHHTGMDMNSGNTNNYSMAAGGVCTFTISSNEKLSIEKEAQLFMKGSYSNDDWATKTPLTATETGWTLTKELPANTQFGFVDEWENWHGGNGYWIYQDEHTYNNETVASDMGKELTLGSDGNFVMVDAGNYVFTVNSDLTTLVVTLVPVAHSITVASDIENGSVEASASTAIAGTEITLTITPDDGYVLDVLTVMAGETEITVTDNKFTMPDADVTITATFKEITARTAMFDFDNDYATLFPTLEGTSSNSSTAGDITEDLTATVDGISLTVSAKTSGSNNNRIWYASPRLRMYSGTITITAPIGYYVTGVEISQGKWNDDNSVDVGTLTSSSWTGEASSIIMSIAGNTQFKSMNVTIDKQPEGAPAAPVISGETPFVGSTEVTITCETEGANIYYTTDDNDPTNESTLYSEPFTLTEGATVKAIAYSVAGVASAIASKTFVKMPSVSTIAEYKELASGIEFVFTGNVTVTYVNGTSLYVKDETGAALIYGTSYDFTQGQVLASGWSATTKDYNGLREAVSPSDNLSAAEQTVEVAPVEKGVNTITTSNDNEYIIVKNVSITSADNKNFTITDVDGNTIAGRTNFSNVTHPTDFDEKYNITCVVAEYNGTVQLYPTNYEVVVQPVTLEGVAFSDGRQWATWYGEEDLALPEDVAAYVVTGLNTAGTAVEVKPIDYIPANTGVLLYSEIAAESVQAMPTEAGESETSLLQGGPATLNNAYVLYNNEFILAQNGTTVGAHRCYLPIGGNAAEAAPRLMIAVGGTVTGVETINSYGNGDDTYYNLMGQPVANPTPGIYIRGGKKVIVK